MSLKKNGKANFSYAQISTFPQRYYTDKDDGYH